MKEIYDEGRVVGLSSYDIYVRQLLSTNPNSSPLTEREWLSANLSESCSMILRIPSGTQKGYHDYYLPEGSDLCSCTLIYGSMFEGNVALTEDGHWAAHVYDYGNLIVNTSDRHPVTPGESGNVPTVPNPEQMSNEYIARCKNYIKITSALVLQPGEWEPNVYYVPLQTQDEDDITNQQNEVVLAPVSDSIAHSHLIPDFSKSGFIRIAVSDTITTDVYIFLHGFAFKTLVKGEVGYSIEEKSTNPQNGDFLGPTVYPWACPVYLTVTTNIQWILYNELLNR